MNAHLMEMEITVSLIPSSTLPIPAVEAIEYDPYLHRTWQDICAEIATAPPLEIPRLARELERKLPPRGQRIVEQQRFRPAPRTMTKQFRRL